jgi:hypothetical protein
MARTSLDIQFNGNVTFAKGGQTFSFSGTNVYEGFENVKTSHNGHSNHGHDVIHLSEVEASGSETNLLHNPVTLTGQAASTLIAQLSGGTTVAPDSDDHGHHHG